ncbi:rCG24612 [Rattus norvegicus]|uniref:RCG24612 n=1 Tax=Rattus norvegicus TaxID=10116 RepID=A6JCK5_RAT|nr:rCG24612 [Rattus norvegicus]
MNMEKEKATVALSSEEDRQTLHLEGDPASDYKDNSAQCHTVHTLSAAAAVVHACHSPAYGVNVRLKDDGTNAEKQGITVQYDQCYNRASSFCLQQREFKRF